MPQAATRSASIPKLNRFGWLMAMYAENHARLARLFAPGDLVEGRYLSSIGDGLDLYLDVIQTHRYTVELRMTSACVIRRPASPILPPSCACTATRGRSKRPIATSVALAGRNRHVSAARRTDRHRMRMNTFLGKWLEYWPSAGMAWRPCVAPKPRWGSGRLD